MDQKDILETVICEMTERALAIRRETCEEAEQQLYKKASALQAETGSAGKTHAGETSGGGRLNCHNQFNRTA